MNFKKNLTRLGIITISLITIVTLSSCSFKITDEQLAQLQELRRQERSLQDGIANKKAELGRIKDEINMRNTELKSCQSELDLIKQRLSKWPDVWPDYTPNK